MAFNGTGTFLRLHSWATDKLNSIPITASRVDAEMDGMATGLSNCITKDGQTTISANIPFNSFKATGLGVGTARTDAITVGQVQDNQFLYLGTTSGSADAYTLAPSPAITAYAATQQFTAKISATNLTTTPYLQISAIASPSTTAVIKKLNATKTEVAVAIGDLVANGIYTFQRNSANNAWIVLELSNPATTTTQGVAFLSNPITISNNASNPNTQMDIGAGIVNYDNGSGQLLCQAITKTLQASGLWTAGTNQNGLDTAPKANSTWYNIFEIVKNSDNTSDILYSLSRTAPTVPTGYTLVVWIGAIRTDASGNIDQNCLAKRTNYGQIVRFQTSDTLTGTGTIPLDDTIPQNTEGDEYMSLQITPLSATSRIQVEVNLKIVNSAVNRVVSALFRDSTANAIDADFRYQAGASNEPHNLILKTSTSSNSTSLTTFKVRAGGGAAGTTRMNGYNAARVFGGACFSSITINEIL